MRNLGLPYHTIDDVCINNCMIFWKENERWEECQFCGAARWKPRDKRRRTKVPYSRMWYLPIADRLKRMYQSKKTAASMMRRGKCVIHLMRRNGNIFKIYILSLPKNLVTFILDYVLMDSIRLGCLVIIHCGP